MTDLAQVPVSSGELLKNMRRQVPAIRSATPDTVWKMGLTPDETRLMAFNGYYALNTRPNAFFALDFNMKWTAGTEGPAFSIDLIVCLDGENCNTYPFTGTFGEDNYLVQVMDDGAAGVQIQFSRGAAAGTATATFNGNFWQNGGVIQNANGITYNNPIPADVWAGTYAVTAGTPVLEIDSDGVLLYDYGSGDGSLRAVESYIYNFNMYFFTVENIDPVQTISLIMGVAGTQGLACNDMTTGGATVSTRFLTTIPGASKSDDFPLASSYALMNLSGFYQFESSEASLTILGLEAWMLSSAWQPVLVTWSPDGTTSESAWVDGINLIFDDATNTLSGAVGNTTVDVVFSPSYNAAYGSIVDVAGTVGQQSMQGYNRFNAIPSSVWAGTYNNTNGDVLVYDGSWSATYNGSTPQESTVILVPLMYMYFSKDDGGNTDLSLSLGTSGEHGRACIVTPYSNGSAQTPVVVYTVVNP